MKALTIIFSFFILLSAFERSSPPLQEEGIDRMEAKLMFDYLQDLRQKKVDKSDSLTRYVKKKSPLLLWNDTLAIVAEARAKDLVRNNYFDHVDKKGNGVNYYIQASGYELESDWTEKKRSNYFESLQAGGDDAYEVIADLIIDEGIPSKGHRKHLLGLDDWNVKNTDIGIAYYRVGNNEKSEYSSYTVIIIARHKW